MPRTPFRLLGLAGALVLSASVASCGKDSAAKPTDCRKARAGSVTIVARDVAWDTSCLDATAGAVAFTIDNKDDVKHNLRITGNGVNEHTKLQNGPIVQHLSAKLGAGTYTFVCDIHANMEGKLYVT